MEPFHQLSDSILTLVLPVYNVASYIERCLKSICNQDGIEQAVILIIDDESPDNSIDISKRYLSQYQNIKWSVISQQNKGLGGARNTGIKNTTTPYVWFIDPDDEIPDGALRKVLSSINDTDDVISFSYLEKPVDLIRGIPTAIEHLSGPESVKYVVANQIWRNIYSMDFLRKYNLFFREKFYHEDGEFSMRIYALAKSISCYPDAIYIYHTNNNTSITNNIKLANFQNLLNYIDTYEDMCRRYPLTYEQLKVLQLEVSLALMYIYCCACKVDSHVWKETMKLIWANNIRINKSLTFLKLKTRFAHFIMSFFPFKFLCKMIYPKF